MDEEVLDFVLDVLLHIVDVLVALPARVIDDGEQLVIAAGLVGHLEDADDAGLNDYAREDRLRQDDQGVERVAVLAQGVVDEAVVSRVSHRGEQVTVEVDLAGLVVNLVLVAGALRDFNGYFNAHSDVLHGGLGINYCP